MLCYGPSCCLLKQQLNFQFSKSYHLHFKISELYQCFSSFIILFNLMRYDKLLFLLIVGYQKQLSMISLFLSIDQLICIDNIFVFNLISTIQKISDLQTIIIIVIKQMYNAFLANKKSIQIQEVKKKTQANSKYVKRYYHLTRPALIDNHNKRINSFIRRMEQEPFQINLDPHLKAQINNEQQNNGLRGQRRSYSHATGRRSSAYQSHDLTPHQQTFKFKDIEDWKSMYTPLERLQRQRNYELFKHKYGDPTIAYRSIGSQSEYKPGHEFRQRDKVQEINPPMRYTNKPTQQVLAKLKNRYKKRNQNSHLNTKQKFNPNDTKTNNFSQQREDDALIRRNTGSSLSGINQDGLLSENQTDRDKVSKDQNSEQDNQMHDGKNKDKDRKKEFKLHFKEVMDLEQSIDDVKTRKALREILYKCGVYRRKNRRVVTDSEVDKLSQFTDGRDH